MRLPLTVIQVRQITRFPAGTLNLVMSNLNHEGGPTFFASRLNRATHGLHTGQDRAPVTGATFCSGMGEEPT